MGSATWVRMRLVTPVFSTVQLAARIEHAEARLTRSVGRAVLAWRPDGDAIVEDLGEGVVVYAAAASPMNKMIGVGFEALPAADRLQVIEEQFARRAAPLQAEVSTLADPSFATMLARRGYVLQGFENVLGRAIVRGDAAPPPNGTIRIELAVDAENDRWLDAAITGFLHPDQQGVQAEPLPPPDELQGAFQDFARAPGFSRYFAWIDGDLAGVASLRIDERLAQLCGAATLPVFRRRGVQTALLRRRLADAVRDGCDLALMTTQPGSKSMENGYRQGFVLLYSRAVMVKPPA